MNKRPDCPACNNSVRYTNGKIGHQFKRGIKMLDLNSIWKILKVSKDRNIQKKIKEKEKELGEELVKLKMQFEFLVNNFTSGYGCGMPPEIYLNNKNYFTIVSNIHYCFYFIADDEKVRILMKKLASEFNEKTNLLESLM